MPAKQGEVMSHTRLEETVSTPQLRIPEPSQSPLGRQRDRCAPNSPPNGEDLIPYSAKDLKYLWTLWDEAQTRQYHGMRYRHISVGAVGLILTGWFMHGLSFSALGGILMLAGAFIGIWFYLKSRRHHKDSVMGG
jgi:hypothetical protein